jgi:selenocysteine-specific translation elongation factor
VVISKLDLITDRKALKKAEQVFAKKKIKTFGLSAATGEGIDKLIKSLAKEVFF